MELRELTEKYLEKIGGMSSLDEVINHTLTTKAKIAESLNKKGHDLDVNLDIIANKPRTFRGNEDINDYHYLLDLERVGHGLQGRWITDLGNQAYSNELQKRVNKIIAGMV
jgi:hypothetical protein